MRRMWSRQDPELVSQGVVDRERWKYGANVSRLHGGVLSSWEPHQPSSWSGR